MPNTAGDTLRKLRGNKPRKVVADAVGISERALQSYECGDRVPRDEVKQRLADYYHRTVGHIFFYPVRPQNVTEKMGEDDGREVVYGK